MHKLKDALSDIFSPLVPNQNGLSNLNELVLDAMLFGLVFLVASFL
ncbi:hypothetical protein [Pedobacter frigiditerrae]|nr:hypothetical protein [Pedobacter frigiditerrae]